MGLDMYISRVKKIDGMTYEEIVNTANYIDYLQRPDKYKDSTANEWNGCNENLVHKEKLDEVRANIQMQYSAWDTEHEYGHEGVSEGVAYWRKANSIHNWFVENCGGGVDECQEMMLSKEDLEDLLYLTKRVYDSCELVDGDVINGYTFKDGKEVPIMEKGKIVKDPSVAMELLPTQSGFFFGGTNYDQWYVEDMKDTIKQLEYILDTTDWAKEYVVYQASW